MTFYLSKILWLIINPFNIILASIFLGIIFNLSSKKIYSKFFFYLALIIFFFTAILPTGKFMLYSLEKNFHKQVTLPEKIDGILILAGATNLELSSEYHNINLNGGVERLIESIFLIQKYPYAKIIFSGGSGSIYKQSITHAEIAKDFFDRFGVDTNNIIFESGSRNTYESILFSKKIINNAPKENWVIITSAYHMKRALFIGEKLNWYFIPYTVDFNMLKKISWAPSINFLQNMNKFQSASHEWIGLISYYFMGRSSKVF